MNATRVTRLDRVHVIGMGEVGRRLGGALAVAGIETVPVTRDRGWDRAVHDSDGLRLVCVREEVLPEALDRLRAVEPSRIAVIQNGWIRPLLSAFPGLTRGLIWFTSKGDFFRVLRPSPFSGPWAEPVAAALAVGGVAATAVDGATLERLEADKMGFNCVVGLPLAVHGLSLAEYLDQMPAEAHELFVESVTVSAAALGTTAEAVWWDEFLKSAAPLGWVRTTSAKALQYRNGAVARLASELDLPVPVTDRLLAAHESRGDRR